MKIRAIEAIPFFIPFRPTVKKSRWSKGRLDRADHVLIRVHGEDGLCGYGEAAARPTIYGESQKSIVAAVEDFFGEALAGMDVMDAEKIQDILDRHPANNTARGALDIAVHDLKARCLGVPLYKLLGGWSDGCIPVTPNVSIKDTMAETVDEALSYIEQGMKTLKIKVGLDPRKDVELVKSVRSAVGENIRIYIDANQGWDRSGAFWALPRMVDCGVFAVEEPLPSGDREGRKRIAGLFPLLIILDEDVKSPGDVAKELKDGAVDIVSVKTPRTGIVNSRKIIEAAELFHVQCFAGTQAETGVGTIASGHNAAAYRNVVNTELANYLRWADDILEERPFFRDGMMILTEKPGLGIAIDEDKLRHYRVDLSL
ncbi:MAG: enolase [Deltaproteobacteria bacterium]|nr:enolase [Deltaproteobacteria bacterium]